MRPSNRRPGRGVNAFGMRIWSLHPRYLDGKGLVALWRETLLARAVLQGKTKGYTHHPQLLRFKYAEEPLKLIDSYLWRVHEEGLARGYNFDESRIGGERFAVAKLPVTEGQLRYEWQHLRAKLLVRCPEWCDRAGEVELPDPHPLFFAVPGPVEVWERSKGD
jgi:hypothetical protein